MNHRLSIPSLDALPSTAARFLRIAGDTPVIAFSGELGAGKTTFIRALCSALGVEMDVNSPTFALVNEYFTSTGESVYHFDLYRIEDPAELFDLGYEEYFYSGKHCFIEWPENAGELVPVDALMVRIVVKSDGTRELRF